MGVAALDFPKDLNFLTLISSSTYLVETFPALKPLLGICSQITQHFVYNSLTNVLICDAIKSFGYRDAWKSYNAFFASKMSFPFVITLNQ